MKERILPKALWYYLCSVINLAVNSNWWVGLEIITGKTVLFKIKSGYGFWVRRYMDIWTIKEVVMDDVYRLNPWKLTRKDVVIDIGAAIGDVCVISAKKGAQVFAFEPDRDRLELLKMNLIQNKTTDVRIFEYPAKSLDQIFKVNKIQTCKILKIDCEGGEYDIFENTNSKTLNKIKNMAMELHLFNPEMVKKYRLLIKRLSDNHFEITELVNQVHSNVKYVFARKLD